MDVDGDGHISKEEFIAAEKKVKGAIKLGDKWDDIMKNCDLDGDGKIDFQEFYTAAVSHQKIITKANIKYAFDCFDVNGDGSIDVEEFKTILPTNYRNTIV
jgi:calcium-dependent protein kinase